MSLRWPPAVLQWPECAEELNPATQQPLWRGLRVRMGIAHGRPQFRKPLNTGLHAQHRTVDALALCSHGRRRCWSWGYNLSHVACCTCARCTQAILSQKGWRKSISLSISTRAEQTKTWEAAIRSGSCARPAGVMTPAVCDACRADYHGLLANLAARLCALANAGQILVEGHGVGTSSRQGKSAKGPKQHREVPALFPTRCWLPWC